MSVLRSRDNPRVRRWAKLVRDSALRRREGRAIVEGPHLLAALLEHGLKPVSVLATENGLGRAEIRKLVEQTRLDPIVLSEATFRSIADADNPPGVAAEIAIPQAKPRAGASTVFLEGVQDPANVGAIVRSAAAFGMGEVVLDRGCADAWSPKVLRAGMGGHFQLRIRSVAAFADELKSFDGKLVCTLPRDGVMLSEADLSGRLGWIFGAEGQGVSPAAARHAALRVTIPMAAGAESLNVAAAAAICLYQAFSRPGAGCAARAGS
jgi:TrmH family RNA methyltransferase